MSTSARQMIRKTIGIKMLTLIGRGRSGLLERNRKFRRQTVWRFRWPFAIFQLTSYAASIKVQKRKQRSTATKPGWSSWPADKHRQKVPSTMTARTRRSAMGSASACERERAQRMKANDPRRRRWRKVAPKWKSRRLHRRTCSEPRR